MFIEVTDPVKITQLLRAGLMWYHYEGEYIHAYVTAGHDRSDEALHQAYADCMQRGWAKYGYMVEE